jgi:hypothetical protein
VVVAEVDHEVEEALVEDVVVFHLEAVIVGDIGVDVAEDTPRTRSGELLSSACRIRFLESVRYLGDQRQPVVAIDESALRKGIGIWESKLHQSDYFYDISTILSYQI